MSIYRMAMKGMVIADERRNIRNSVHYYSGYGTDICSSRAKDYGDAYKIREHCRKRNI